MYSLVTLFMRGDIPWLLSGFTTKHDDYSGAAKPPVRLPGNLWSGQAGTTPILHCAEEPPGMLPIPVRLLPVLTAPAMDPVHRLLSWRRLCPD